MNAEHITIYGKPVTILDGGDLNDGQIERFAKKVSKSLKTFPYTQPVDEATVAKQMSDDMAVVIVDKTDSGLLLAHANLLPIDDEVTELAGWVSYADGCGTKVLQAGAKKGSANGKLTHTSVHIDNKRANIKVQNAGGIYIGTRNSIRTGNPVNIFNLTPLGKA